MGGGGKGGSPDISYTSPPGMDQFWEGLMNYIGQMYGGGGMGQMGGGGFPDRGGLQDRDGGMGGGWQRPQSGIAPQQGGYSSSPDPGGGNETGPAQIPAAGFVQSPGGGQFGGGGATGGWGGGKGGGGRGGDIWDIPNAPAPTADWYNNLSPDILAGLQQPYMDAQRQGMELLGGGTARVPEGMSGATGVQGAMTGDIMGQMAQNVPMQAWNMTQPGAMAQWGQEVERGRYPMTAAVNMLGGTMPEAVVSNSGGAAGALAGGLGGYGLAGLMPGVGLGGQLLGGGLGGLLGMK